ncbi:MAG: pabC [Bacillales bacterium]|jgi:4-amino-4-deoxychorismate lyase|nr:pabC [Bacillales bacterium]
MYIIQNGQVIRSDEAHVSPFDHGFLYGVGVFETFRTSNGEVLLLNEHYDRLCNALSVLRIKNTLTIDKIRHWVNELLEANNLNDGYFRLNISAGVAPLGLPNKNYDNPNTFLFIKELPELPLEKRCMILKTKRNTPEGEIRLKSHHYLNSVLGKYELDDYVDAEGILITRDGFIAEGLVSNIFFAKGNMLYTPSSDTGILEGITRKYIIEELCFKNNIEVTMGNFELSFLNECDEIFLCNSIQGVVPVFKVNNMYFPGVNGKLTNKIKNLYNKNLLLKAEF